MKIKPFYIRYTPDLTHKQVAKVFDKAVSCGAELGNGVKGFHSAEKCGDGTYPPEWFQFFGVTTNNETWMSDIVGLFGEEIRLDQVDEWLGIAQPTVQERMAAYDQKRMLERDERKRSQAEKDYDLKVLDAEVKKMVIDYRKELTIPSTLPTEQAMPMMLGGEFGGDV